MSLLGHRQELLPCRDAWKSLDRHRHDRSGRKAVVPTAGRIALARSSVRGERELLHWPAGPTPIRQRGLWAHRPTIRQPIGRPGIHGGSFWGRLVVDTGSIWSRRAVDLGHAPGRFRIDAGSIRARLGGDLESTWGQSGADAVSVWGRSGIDSGPIRGSRHRLSSSGVDPWVDLGSLMSACGGFGVYSG